MKLLNILGAVVAVHVAVLVLAVAIPGCRSSGKAVPAAAASNPEPDPYAQTATSPFSAAPEMTARDLNPPLASPAAPMFDPDAPAVARSSAGGRQTPTRPGSPVATALAPTTVVADVTPAVTYTVKGGDSLWALARKHGITVRELTAANSLAPDAVLRVGQVLVIPGAAPAAGGGSSTASAAEAPAATYEIRPGDTLATIARRHGTTVAALKAFNNLRGDMVRAGDRLAIPDTALVSPSSPSTTTTSTATAPSTPAPSPAGRSTVKHVVQSGESLTLIARRYGVKIGDVALANQIGDPSMIRPGQELVIPGVSAEAAPAVRATPPPAPASTLSPEADLDEGLADPANTDVPVIQVEDTVPTITLGE